MRQRKSGASLKVAGAVLASLIACVVVFQNCSSNFRAARIGAPDALGLSTNDSGLISIDSQPASGNVVPGGTLTLEVIAHSLEGKELTYQWYKDLSPIAEFTSNKIEISNAQNYHMGSYLCVVSDGLHSVSSIEAVISFPSKGVFFVKQPNSISTNTGTPSQLESVASSLSNGTISYQWYKEGNPMSGYVTPTLTFNPTRATDAGTYYVVARDSSGATVQSSSAVISVNVVQVTVDLYNAKGCSTGYCFCGNFTSDGAPAADGSVNGDAANIICQRKGYSSAVSIATMPGPLNAMICPPNGGSCFYNASQANLVCSSLVCQ